MSYRLRNIETIRINTKELSKKEILKLMPRKVFKYYSINENTISVLENHKLWFSTPNSFNDPFDCKINIDFGKTKSEINKNLMKYYQELLNDNEINESFKRLAWKTKKFNNVFNLLTHYSFANRLGVCCFSEVPDSPLMWSHYSNSHTGICLKFLNTTRNIVYDNLIPVQYYKEYPKYILSKTENIRSLLLQCVSSKSDDWDYEFEWRAVTATGGN